MLFLFGLLPALPLLACVALLCAAPAILVQDALVVVLGNAVAGVRWPWWGS